MKCRKNVLMSILAGVISCSYCMTASAGTYSDAYMLKRGLLLLEAGNKQYRIMDYNTNGDKKANVLDLCRMKKDIIDENQPASQYVSLEAVTPWVSDDKARITVPVKIKGNTLGVSSVSFTVEYDTWYFELSDVYTSTNDKVSFSVKNDRVQYLSGNNNNNTSEGYLVYLVFDVSPEVPYDTHTIELTDIQYAMINNGSARELSSGECSDYAKLSFEFSRSEAAQTTSSVTETTTAGTSAVSETEPSSVTTEKVTTVNQKTDMLYFALDNAQLYDNDHKLKIPVYMNQNTGKIGSFEAKVSYDSNKFTLKGVERGDFEGYGYLNGESAVYNLQNWQNTDRESGIFTYLIFDVNGAADSKEYKFMLTDIKAMYYDNWSMKAVDRYQNSTEASVLKMTGDSPSETTAVTTEEASVTDPVETTTVTTVTKPVVTTVSADPSDYTLNDDQLWFIDQINKYRASNGVPEIIVLKQAFKSADERAKMLSESFSENLPDGRNFKWALYDNDVYVYSISQSIDNKSTTREQALSYYLTGSSSYILNNDMFDSFAVGHYTDGNGRHFWAMFTYS